MVKYKVNVFGFRFSVFGFRFSVFGFQQFLILLNTENQKLKTMFYNTGLRLITSVFSAFRSTRLVIFILARPNSVLLLIRK